MRANETHKLELIRIGKELEKIYEEAKDYPIIFNIIDKIVDKFCDPIDMYGTMYLSDCVLYMNIKWARDFLKEVKDLCRKENVEKDIVCRRQF